MRAAYDVFASVLGRAGIGFTPDRPASVSDLALETRALVEAGLSNGGHDADDGGVEAVPAQPVRERRSGAGC